MSELKYMTKYEYAKIIGTRAQQISNNFPIMITNLRGIRDPRRIAQMELRERKMPIKIRRTLPDGTFEDICVNDLVSF